MEELKIIDVSDVLQSCGFKTTAELRAAGIKSTESMAAVRRIGCKEYLRGPDGKPIYVVMDYGEHARNSAMKNLLIGSTVSLALVALFLLASRNQK